MSKMHYADDRSVALPCGQDIGTVKTTDRREEVTCHWCKKWLAEGWRD